MKVLILHNDFRVYWKGRLTFLNQFLKSQDIDLYAIELFGKGSPYAFDTYDNKENWWACLFPDNSVDDLSKKSIRKAIVSKLDEINPDIVIGGSIVFFAGALGIRWAKNNNKKFIMFDDAKPSQVKRNFLVQRVKNLITNEIDGLWLPSKEYEKEYSNIKLKRSLVFHGYNCIDNALFKYKNSQKMDYTTIICVARLVPIKNINNLLKAWQIVEQENETYKLIIIGDGPEYGTLNELSLNLNLKRMVFLGALKNEDIPTYFYNSDAFVLPSLSESWGLVVNEAMAASLPILLSNKINASECLLKPGINGFAFEPLNVDDIANALLKYINLDRETKKTMSANSLNTINSMSYENMGVQLLNELQHLLIQPTKTPGFLSGQIINIWDGKYNVSRWNTIS